MPSRRRKLVMTRYYYVYVHCFNFIINVVFKLSHNLYIIMINNYCESWQWLLLSDSLIYDYVTNAFL